MWCLTQTPQITRFNEKLMSYLSNLCSGPLGGKNGIIVCMSVRCHHASAAKIGEELTRRRHAKTMT